MPAANNGHILLPDSKLQMLEHLISRFCILRAMSFESGNKNMPANVSVQQFKN
jgi:hypothetical protein